jgi:N utilization substance protein B
MTRHEIRETAFILLFEASFREEDPAELYALAEEIGEWEVNAEVRALVEGVLAESDALDGIIASYSKKRALNRIARVNLIVLRIAIYEISKRPDVPVNVAVSEAVALSGKYAGSEDISFINGVLGAYVRSLPPRDGAAQEA